jgi:N-acetylmuramic acid 6-phosphate (MurNAc-6-P) etherase
VQVKGNFMIDLQVSNNKLFFRSVSIVQRFAECDSASATTALLRSIYLTDSVSEQVFLPLAIASAS